ncbi:MAG: hypothetical protein P8X64_04650 [Anaerolineales bacterium]|jgi:hypothetical protein
MDSREMLRRWSQTSWPADDFTLEGNLADLDRHQREHEAGEAFTYTIVNPAGDRCLGCIYVNPLTTELIESGICNKHAAPGPVTAASIRFWVRSSLLDSDLELELLQALRKWFAQEWRLDCVIFLTSLLDERQQAFWEANDLVRLETFQAYGRTWVAYKPHEQR